MHTQRPSRIRFLILVGLCFAAALAYAQRNSIVVMEKSIREELALTKDQSAVMMSGFFIAYALGQIPSAECAQRFGTRVTLSVSVIAFSVATAGMGLSAGFVSLLAARLAMGIAQAGLLPCATEILGRWFHPSRRAFVNGLVGGSLSIGGAVGAMLTGLLTVALGWRLVHLAYALPGLAAGMALWCWFRGYPADHPRVNAQELALIAGQVEGVSGNPRVSTLASWKGILRQPALFWLCGQQFFRAAGYMFYTSWFTTFLQETYRIKLPEAGLLTSLPVLTTVAGSAVGGAVSDVLTVRSSRKAGRQQLSAVSMAACAGLILAASTISNAWPAVLVISLGSFCAAFAGPCASATVTDLGGAHVPRVFATMNMCGNAGATVFPLIVPWITARSENWHVVLLVFAAIYVAAGICWLFFDTGNSIVGSEGRLCPQVLAGEK
jgi:MFS transporter, ACS family, D-galactonate transporter